MHLTFQQVVSMTEESFRAFLELAVPEGLYLDYKAGLVLDKDAKREFLKDVTAFANAAGGHLIFGVKEPAEALSVEDRLVGLDDGDTLRQALECLASASVDPRIPGLQIVPIKFASGKSYLIIHVPPSLSRPHMVNFEKHRTFYVRHSESSFPMTTHEVREAVLTSASAVASARSFVERRLAEVRQTIGDQQPAFFLQAMPLITPEIPWDVLSLPFENVVRGEARRNKYEWYADLASNVAPRPTIDGVLGQYERDLPKWETEVHRTGYVSLLYQNIQRDSDRFTLYPETCDIFRAFCDMLRELLEISKTDVPYLLTCRYINAEGTHLYIKSSWHRKYSEPCKKREISWPEHFRATGSDPMVIAESMAVQMFNAFGFKGIVS